MNFVYNQFSISKSLLTLDQDVIIFLVSVARGVCRLQGLVLALWPNQYVTVL